MYEGTRPVYAESEPNRPEVLIGCATSTVQTRTKPIMGG